MGFRIENGVLVKYTDDVVMQAAILSSIKETGNIVFVSGASLMIPDNVTSIGNGAFLGCTSLTSLIIPESVTSIGDWAFSNCTNLTSITIPKSITSIGDCAFYGCMSLTNLTIPYGVTSIGRNVFSDCTSLANLTIPESVTSIGEFAFSGCTGLRSLTIPESVTSIGDGAFSCCENLTDITIPESVISIGDRIFRGCTNLENVCLPEGMTSTDDVYSIDEDDEDYDWEDEQEYHEEECKKRIAEKCKRYEDDCIVVKSIPSFSGKTFVASGVGNEDEIKSFLTDKGAFLRKSISGKTNYLIVSPERDSDSKYKAVLEQYAKGHTVEVIFYEDFVKYMEDNIDDIEEDINDDSPVGNDKVGAFANQETADASRMSEISDQLQSLTSQMQSGLSDMRAFVEREKLRLEEEERKKEELEKKKQAAKENRDADEESVFMYMTLIIEAANEQNRSDDDFYSCYEEDFPALDKNDLSQLRRKIKAEMQDDPNCYEDAACALPYDKRYYYSAHNMYNTHDYSGDPNEDIESLIMDTVSRWFESSELSQVRSGIKQLIDNGRMNLDEGLSSVNADWKNFHLAKKSLYIGLLDDTAETYDPKNKLMVRYGNVIGAVQLATTGFFRMSTTLMNHFTVYWNVTLEEIWNAAKENGVYDQRESNSDGQEERIAQEVYDKAMQKIGVSVKTSPSSYSSRLTESVYVRSNYDTMSSFYGDDDSYDDSPKKKEGCYIATAIYGSYDAPEVITLRQFRDETLKKSFFGRMFIKVYYTLSPPVAEKLKNAHRVNTFVRSILDKWVAHLNSK